MRQELDEQRDIMSLVHSDNVIAHSHEYNDGFTKHVTHLDADGQIVRSEIHEYSKFEEASKRRAEQTTRAEFRAGADADEILGNVEWEICSGTKGEVQETGTTVARLCDFKADLINDPVTRLMSVGFPITDNLRFSLATSLSPTKTISGFALFADRSDIQTFCWEWFDVDAVNHAKKRQEQGELRFEVAKRGTHWQVVRTDCLTDISVRVSRMTEASGRELISRVVIRRGSAISWPCVKKGKLVAR